MVYSRNKSCAHIVWFGAVLVNVGDEQNQDGWLQMVWRKSSLSSSIHVVIATTLKSTK